MVALDSSLLESKRQLPVSLVSRVNRTSGADCTIRNSMYQPSYTLNKIKQSTIYDKCQTPTCFGTGMLSSGSLPKHKTNPKLHLRYQLPSLLSFNF